MVKNINGYLNAETERMFRGTSYQPLYQPSYPRNTFNRFLEKCNTLASKIEREIKKQKEGGK